MRTVLCVSALMSLAGCPGAPTTPTASLAAVTFVNLVNGDGRSGFARCLPRPLEVQFDSAGRSTVTCYLRVFYRSSTGQCNRSRGEAPIAEGSGVCTITQLPTRNFAIPIGVGWFYQEFSSPRNGCSQQ